MNDTAISAELSETALRTLLRTWLDAVPTFREDLAQRAQMYHDKLAKPPGSLGVLEAVSTRLVGITGMLPPPIPRRPIAIIVAADHGVVAQGVTSVPASMTAAIVANVLQGRGVASVLARSAAAAFTVLDVGVQYEIAPHPLLVSERVRAGTRDMTNEPALTEHEALRALTSGYLHAKQLLNGGADLVALGEIGVGNTTASAALVAALTLTPIDTVAPAYVGVDTHRLERKRTALQRTLQLHQPDRNNALHALASIGGLEHAAMVGVIIACASHRVPVILDGFVPGAAALVAVLLQPRLVHYLLAAQQASEPAVEIIWSQLRLEPLLHAQVRVGEAAGALLAIPLVQASARVFREVATHDDLGS